MFGDVINDVDDFRNFERAVAQRLDFLRGGLHRSANALHAFQRVAHGPVALFGGVERAASCFRAGFGVVGHLFHRYGEFFDGAGRVRDFLVLLRRAGLHFVGSYENVVGARGDFHRGFANALENLREVVEHVVDGVCDVPERVIGDFAAQRQIAARNLIDDREQFGDAALQVVASFLVAGGFRDASYGAIQIFGDVAELIVGVDFNARARVAGGKALGELRELGHRTNKRAVQPPREKYDRPQHQEQGNQHRPAGAAR